MLIQRSAAVGRPRRSRRWGLQAPAGVRRPPRDRAVRRRRGLGRFGTGTSRVVVQHEIRSTLESTSAPDISPSNTGFRSAVAAGMVPTHSWTHPEGWRDWPDETPATARRGKHARERCQFLKDVAGGSRQTSATNRRRFFQMGASNLKCRECGAEYALEARYVCERCFGPARGRLRPRRPRPPTATSCAAASRAARRTSGATRTSCRSRRSPARRARVVARAACPPAARR